MDKAEKSLNEARRLIKEGQYARAVRQLVWFHNNALKVRPSYYGVRLSFALRDWLELGEKYPPAIEKLKRIMDAKTTRLERGAKSRELFHDIVAINDYLGRTQKTVQLFKAIDASDPAFASMIYYLAEADLVDHKEFKLARKHLGRPKDRVADAKTNFVQGMAFAKRRHPAARRACEHIFTEDAVRIIKILRETGDRAGAKKIQLRALKVFDSAKIRNVLRS